MVADYRVTVDYEQQYQASDDELRDAVAELLSLGVPGDGSQALVGFHLAPRSRFGMIGRVTELAVFSEAFHETSGTLAREYAPYEDISGFFVVIDTTSGLPAGTSRYVDGGVELNPTLRDLESIGSMPEVLRFVGCSKHIRERGTCSPLRFIRPTAVTTAVIGRWACSGG